MQKRALHFDCRYLKFISIQGEKLLEINKIDIKTNSITKILHFVLSFYYFFTF